MRAVWQVARRAVRRRRLQTFVIGVVVLFSTASLVLALALLASLSAPFDKAFAAGRGAQVVASFDLTRASLDQLSAAGGQATFPTTVVQMNEEVHVPGARPGPLTVAGRAGPGGPVDRLDLWWGRWPAADGEIVLDTLPVPRGLPTEGFGGSFTGPDGKTFTIVGLAYSLGQTADAWVTPAQLTALGPTGAQVLYRWSGSGLDTQAGLDARLAEATRALPAGALADARSYLTLRAAAASGPARYLPFLAIFGGLGVAVAVLIVTNVVSGAVVSGIRQIGVLKAVGFTPRQVVAVHVLTAGVPALAGALLGAAAGYPLASSTLDDAFSDAGLGQVGVAAWPVAAAALGMLAVVVLAAFVPAMRAHRLSAAEAISAGNATRAGRALRTQRRLGGSRLPRSVSLGLGLPLARPGRTVLTAAAVVLGVTTVTFAAGVTASLGRFADARDNSEAVQAVVLPEWHGPGPAAAPPVDAAATRDMLDALPGAAGVTALAQQTVAVAGDAEPANMQYFHGGYASLGFQDQLVRGRWLAGPAETVVTSGWLRLREASIGDRITLVCDGARTDLTIVGEVMGDDTDLAYAIAPPGKQPAGTLVQYLVRLDPGTSLRSYADAVSATGAGLMAMANDSGSNEFIVTVVSLAVVLTVMLSTVAALGVFQTVVLDTRERRRDLGMLKSIGMTPRQIVTMMVSAMAALGTLAGLVGVGLGMLAQRVSVPLVASAAGTDIPATMLTVWRLPLVLPLLLAGVAIAVLGAFLPARTAGRLPVADALRAE